VNNHHGLRRAEETSEGNQRLFMRCSTDDDDDEQEVGVFYLMIHKKALLSYPGAQYLYRAECVHPP
jgi:hypothetical protein